MVGTFGRGLITFCLAFFVVSSASRSAAQVISFVPPSGVKFRATIARLAPDQRQAIEETIAQVFPIFVFLPGIMGSKLVKKLPNGKDKLIWGVNQGFFAPPDEDLAYSETDQVTPQILNEYYIYNKDFDIYGEAIQTIRYMDLSSGDNVRLFPYDWRQSNLKSAQRLSEWLCEERQTMDGRPIVFMAHSMGGLVLKYWLKNSYDSEGCAGEHSKFSEWIKIKKIIFLGTPHYGAPKAITAFADQYSLLVDPETRLGKLLGGLDARTFSKSINLYGATFPSAYELLPIINTTNCFKNADWPNAIEIRQPDGSSHANIDLFHPSTWELFRWPKMLGPTIPRDKFVKERLPSLLRSAKTFLCGLSGYEPDDRFDVTRVYGNKNPTVCKVIIIQPVKPEEAPTIQTQRCDDDDNGDGTVPSWIASEGKRAAADKIRPATNGHMNLLGSPEFIVYLKRYRDQLHREMPDSYEKKYGNVDGLVNMYASLRYFVPSASGDNPDDPISRMTRQILAKLDINAKNIYAAAKGKQDPLARANAYRVFADVADRNDLNRPWALNNAAHILLDEGQFVAARDLGKSAVKAADFLPNGASKVKATAGLTTAVAAEKINDFDTARTFGAIAVEYGNMKALRYIAQ